MNFDKLLKKNILPDYAIRLGARFFTKARLNEISSLSIEAHREYFNEYIETLKKQPIAINTSDANRQHYELPTHFFEKVLGNHMKYSCGYWDDSIEFKHLKNHLEDSELKMLNLTCERAGIEDGQKILELGCGWGSLSLFMALKYPNSKIVAVSNSSTQKDYIDKKIEEEKFNNLRVVTADINDFDTEEKFDKIISVEMFEHMRNYQKLMDKIRAFLVPKGQLFVHIFTHKFTPYSYEVRSKNDWMTKYFFSGGTMPSQDLLHYFQEGFNLKNQWAISGSHYQKTLEAWRQRMDEKKEQIMPIMAQIEGEEQAIKWWVYWRVFFIASAEFFGFKEGNEWFVSHYLFEKQND